MSDQEPWDGVDRRKIPRIEDGFYRFVQILNAVGWFTFVAALIVFHYARPELISGLQQFWGLQGRTEWSASLSSYLLGLLVVCLSLATTVLVMKRRRNRRKNDFLGVNAFFLLFISLAILAWVYVQMS